MRSRALAICSLELSIALALVPEPSPAQSQNVALAEKAEIQRPETAALASTLSSRNTEANIRQTNPDFVIGPSDVLAISVWREPEISRTVPVRPDGKISLPLLGDLTASGLTADQLQGAIKRQLQSYISNPDVTVIVQDVKSRQVNVFGEVAKPGSYVLAKSMTVLDAIASAGGLKDFAKAKKVYVLRVSNDGGRARIPFNYKAAIKGDNPAQDIELQPRDIVVVP